MKITENDSIICLLFINIYMFEGYCSQKCILHKTKWAGKSLNYDMS